MKPKLLLLTIAPVLVIVAAWFTLTRSARAAATTLEYSGTVEAEQITIAPEIGGRVTEVRVKEGDTVNAGDVLVQLDPALVDAQIQQAQAALATAQANLAQLVAGTRGGHRGGGGCAGASRRRPGWRTKDV